MDEMQFSAVVVPVGRTRAAIPVPFDPDQVWGVKPRHHVAGTVNGRRIRAVIEAVEGVPGPAFTLGPVWRRDNAVDPGQRVEVRLEPEGPQREDLPADLAAALAAEPAAGESFDALAQFYRKGYLTWIDGAKRYPERRAARIADVVGWLVEGRKTRPKNE